MATVEMIARAALGDLAVDQNHLLNGVRWVNDRYAEFAGSVRLKQLRRLGELTIPAVVTAGTVTVTASSPTVTGNATAAAAWSVTMEGRYFQIDRVWYRIASVNPTALTLTLAEPYAGDTAAASTYRVVARYVPLAEDCRTLVAIIHDRFNRELTRRSLPWLNMFAPERFYQLGGPQTCVDIGEDATTRRRVLEIYPYSDDDEHLRYAYYAAPPRLDLDDSLPAGVDQDALKEGVLVDVMRWKMARAADLMQADIAALWRNEYRAQETKWQTAMARLRRADMAIEDLTWITRSQKGGWVQSDISTAEDQVFATGTRP